MNTEHINSTKLNNDANDYLTQRNKTFFRGHSNLAHPLYETEINHAIKNIKIFLSDSILSQAYFNRLRKLYVTSAEKCWSNTANNYSYSEANACEEFLLEKDAVLQNIENFKKEIEVRIIDQYEKKVKFNDEVKRNFDPKRYEELHRKFLLDLNYTHRMEYYLLAKKVFNNH